MVIVVALVVAGVQCRTVPDDIRFDPSVIRGTESTEIGQLHGIRILEAMYQVTYSSHSQDVFCGCPGPDAVKAIGSSIKVALGSA